MILFSLGFAACELHKALIYKATKCARKTQKGALAE
jgi:hypothetical protein